MRQQQILTFKLGEESFAVRVEQVREILDPPDITRVPQMPDYMLGVLNLRGNVVPVVDLRRKFGMAAAVPTRDSCVIVIEVDCGGEQTVIGAFVDAVQEVLELAPELVEPPPRMGMKLKSDFISGMGKKGEEFIIILDIDRIFSTEELITLHPED